MAVSVNYLWEHIRNLGKDGQAGYTTSSDFNNDLYDAQTTLFEYYRKIYHETEKIHSALSPFIIEANLTLTQGVDAATTPRPPDYAHELQVYYRKVTNAKPSPKIRIIPAFPMHDHEEATTLGSYIRKPSLAKNIIRYCYKNSLLHVYPKELTNIYYKYLQIPPVPLTNNLPTWWVGTLTSTPDGDFELYNPTLSTDLVWPEQETSNFVDLLLFYTGIETRDTPLIKFATMKQKEGLINGTV